MANEITMPKLGLTMTEGTVSEWKKQEGDPVEKGEIILVVATDKLTFEVEAEQSGVLAKILVPAGSSAAVSDAVGIIAAPGEEVETSFPAAEEPVTKEKPVKIESETSASPEKKPVESSEMSEAGIGEGTSVLVIGAGPGGYVSAIRAAQLGADVTIVDRKYYGGTCLNVGCIPTKVLLHTVELFNAVKEGEMIGLKADNVEVDWSALMKRKEQVTAQLVGGVRSLLSSNGVKMLEGDASFISDSEIRVSSSGKDQVLSPDYCIIAAGSEPVVPPVPGIDSKGVITSNEALSLDKVPDSMTIVGGGVIGVEFASIFASLGTRVTIVEMLPEILPNTDKEIVAVLKSVLAAKGVEILTSSKVTRFREENGSLVSEVKMSEGDREIITEKVLVSVGRKPSTSTLGLENTGVKMDRAKIIIDKKMKTSVDSIYAIGDCCSPIMLAHVASREGEVAAENIMGHKTVMDYKTNPGAVYTSPEIAWAGLTEEQAVEKGHNVKIGKFPLIANGKSLIMNETEGFIKFVVDEKYDEILGVHIIGPRATDLIVEAALALRLEATIDEIVTTIHAHPTIGEALGEAALDVNNIAVHIPPRK